MCFISTFNNEKIWAMFSNIHHSPYIFVFYSSSICLFVFCVQLDRFASIRIPGSRKDRPPMSHFKHSASDWSISSSSTTNPFDELSSKITSEKEILALFEKMMVYTINTLRIVFELNISFLNINNTSALKYGVKWIRKMTWQWICCEIFTHLVKILEFRLTCLKFWHSPSSLYFSRRTWTWTKKKRPL